MRMKLDSHQILCVRRRHNQNNERVRVQRKVHHECVGSKGQDVRKDAGLVPRQQETCLPWLCAKPELVRDFCTSTWRFELDCWLVACQRVTPMTRFQSQCGSWVGMIVTSKLWCCIQIREICWYRVRCMQQYIWYNQKIHVVCFPYVW